MSKFTAQIIFSFSLNPLEARLGFLLTNLQVLMNKALKHLFWLALLYTRNTTIKTCFN